MVPKNPNTIPIPNCRILFKEPRKPLYEIKRPTIAQIYEGLLYLQPETLMMIERKDGGCLFVEGSLEKGCVLWREQSGKSRVKHFRKARGIKIEHLIVAFAKKTSIRVYKSMHFKRG